MSGVFSARALYPQSSDPTELRRASTEQARALDLNVQTHGAHVQRLAKLEAGQDDITNKLAALLLEIRVAEAKVKGMVITLTVVWTVLAALFTVLSRLLFPGTPH